MAELLRIQPKNDGVVVFTGGLNERVSNLELTPGELYDCSNYMELGGRYHGYTSPKGYEVSDGATLTITGIVTGAVHASDIPAVAVPDEGGTTDNRVTLLIEASNGVSAQDYSAVSGTVTTSGNVSHNTTYTHLGTSSFLLQGSGAIHCSAATSAADFNFAQASASKISTVEANLRVPTTPTSVLLIAEKSNSWKIEVDQNRKVIFTHYRSTIANAITGTTALDFNAFNNIAVTYAQDNKFRLFVNGTLGATSTSGSPDAPTGNTVVIGNSPQFWYLDSFRTSSACRGTHDFDVATARWSTDGFFDIRYDDSWREYKRGLVTVPSTTGSPASGAISCVKVYDETASGGVRTIVAARPTSGASTIDFYEQTSGGWSAIGTSNTVTSQADAKVVMTLGRFSDYPVGNTNKELLFATISTDTSAAYYLYDGNTMASAAPTGILPSGAEYVAPIGCYCHDNRLFLWYSGGVLKISGIGNPTLQDGSTDNATTYYFASEIISVEHLQSNVVGVFCEKGIYILKGTSVAEEGTGTGWLWQQDTITEHTNVIDGTVRKFGRTVYFIGNEGLKSLETTDAYGDFKEAALSHKVNDTLLKNLDYIVGTTVNNETGQYRVYFNDSTNNKSFALYFTFNEDGTVKGSTKLEFEYLEDNIKNATCYTYSSKDDTSYFGADDGFVYKLDSGTSENGEDIQTNMKSGFYHYNSPRHWKLLRSILFELESSPFLSIEVKVRYSYDRTDLARATSSTKFIKTAGSKWASAVYGSFVWGGSIIGNPMFYPYGHGVNMSIEVSTSNRWLTQHIVNNAITDFTVLGRQI